MPAQPFVVQHGEGQARERIRPASHTDAVLGDRLGVLLLQDLLDPQIQLAGLDHVLPGRLDNICRARNPALRQLLRGPRVGVLVGRDQAMGRNVLDLQPQPSFGLLNKAVAQRCQVGEEMDAAPPLLVPLAAGLHLLWRQRLLIEDFRPPHLVDGLEHADLLAHIGKVGRKDGDDMAFALDRHVVVQPGQRR